MGINTGFYFSIGLHVVYSFCALLIQEYENEGLCVHCWASIEDFMNSQGLTKFGEIKVLLITKS